MSGLVTPVEPVPLGELGKVHFIGIGGAGMSGIARIMLARGTPVSGSDSAASAVLDSLAEAGAKTHVGHAADNLGDADTVVVSSAIREDNPELAQARQRGLRVLHRSSALASLMVGRRVIAVTGTHGKTSTTSMITTILTETGADPGYAIGGNLAATGKNAADGKGTAKREGTFFVAEADESDGSFLNYAPDAAVITNVEADHLDNHGTPEAYRSSFVKFLGRIKPGGLLVTCADDPGARELAETARGLGITVRTYGESPDADYRVTGVTAGGMEIWASVSRSDGAFGEKGVELVIGVPGRHNALNAAAAFAVTTELGTGPRQAAAGLRAYRGAARRMEPKGEAAGVRVLDTYAHHPTELAADLRAARDLAGGTRGDGSGPGRVIAVFQPHLFSRTRIFASDFGQALGLADVAVVLDIYAAREDPEPGVTGKVVADAVPSGTAEVRYVPEFADAPSTVASIAKPGDVVLTMGAGDVTRLGPRILEELGR
ncbi:MAG TPA: UDP-N-acetylmuramate--L-alanine ligase [Trebonia sp.]